MRRLDPGDLGGGEQRAAARHALPAPPTARLRALELVHEGSCSSVLGLQHRLAGGLRRGLPERRGDSPARARAHRPAPGRVAPCTWRRGLHLRLRERRGPGVHGRGVAASVGAASARPASSSSGVSASSSGAASARRLLVVACVAAAVARSVRERRARRVVGVGVLDDARGGEGSVDRARQSSTVDRMV